MEPQPSSSDNKDEDKEADDKTTTPTITETETATTKEQVEDKKETEHAEEDDKKADAVDDDDKKEESKESEDDDEKKKKEVKDEAGEVDDADADVDADEKKDTPAATTATATATAAATTKDKDKKELSLVEQAELAELDSSTGPAPPDAVRPKNNDILFGRGKPFQNHPGNRKMLQLIDRYKQQYSESPRDRKRPIVEEIIGLLSQDGGRFLKRYNEDVNSTWWVEVSNQIAFDKVRYVCLCVYVFVRMTNLCVCSLLTYVPTFARLLLVMHFGHGAVLRKNRLVCLPPPPLITAVLTTI
jgi:hypothetical protein